MKNELSSSVNLALNKAARAASALKTPYITPELFLQGLLALDRFRSVVSGLVPHMSVVEKALSDYIDEHAEKEDKAPDGLELSFQLMQVFEFADEQVTNIMVLGKDNREERRELTKNWKQIEALKGHPTIGNLATLLAEGHPFCLCKEALLLTFNFTRLKNQANVKANQAAISAMVEKLLGRKVFVYSLDRLDCNKYYTDFSNKEQLNKLPNKKEIQLELPKGE